jgi:hypothetical protein
LERPTGQGTIIHCQLRLVEKFSSEPAAGLIFRNLLDYCDQYRPQTRDTAVLTKDPEYVSTLRTLGLRFDVLADNARWEDISNYSLVICHGDLGDAPERAATLARFVEQGGMLLVHRPSPATTRMIGASLGTDLMAQPYAGPVKRLDGDHVLFEAIAREDLYWTVKRPGLSWVRQPLSPDMTDGVFGNRFTTEKAESFELEHWKTEGQYVLANESRVLFASAGIAAGEIDFPESGQYGLGILARGTPCDGTFPIAEVTVGGKPFGFMQLDGPDWKAYGVFGQVDKGRHQVKVAFVNDASNPPAEDRNLEVDKLYVVRGERDSNVTLLTAPAALVTLDRGKGSVVLDRVRWDTEEHNGQKAARYACSLLTTLGADFTPRSSVTIECEVMTPEPGMQHFRVDGGTAYMGCNGHLSTGIRVAETRDYSVEVIASGDASEGICPLVELYVGGVMVDEIQLTTEGWRAYPLTLQLDKGQHEFSLKFVNDHSSPSGDRNLRLDKVVIYND